MACLIVPCSGEEAMGEEALLYLTAAHRRMKACRIRDGNGKHIVGKRLYGEGRPPTGEGMPRW
jgi:hypothetical protein